MRELAACLAKIRVRKHALRKVRRRALVSPALTLLAAMHGQGPGVSACYGGATSQRAFSQKTPAVERSVDTMSLRQLDVESLLTKELCLWEGRSILTMTPFHEKELQDHIAELLGSL